MDYDAKRLKACVDACEGIDTETLKPGLVAELQYDSDTLLFGYDEDWLARRYDEAACSGHEWDCDIAHEGSVYYALPKERRLVLRERVTDYMISEFVLGVIWDNAVDAVELAVKGEI